MKIKCPACSKVLNIPDSAAGKVVKCPCGKQLRAPGGASGSPAAAPKPAGNPAARPAANRPAAAPVAATPGSGVSGFDADMLDELTDADLQPVKSVSKVGGPAAQPKKASGEAVLQKYASSQDRRGEALIHQGLSPRPGFLMFLGIINACGSMVWFGLALLMAGVVAMIPAIEEEVPEETGIALTVIILAFVVMGILSIATAIACFVRGRFYWYILAFSYSYGFTDRVFGVIGDFMAEEGGGGGAIVGSVIGIVIGLALWAYMHGDDVRGFHGTEEESIGKIAAINVAGMAFGCGLSGAAVFLAQ